MIKFNGKINCEECVQFIKKHETTNLRKIIIMVMIVLAAMIIGLALIASKWFFLMLAVLPVFLIFMFPRADIGKRLPINVEIEENSIAITTETFSETFDIDDVEKVVDKGAWYQIYVYSTENAPYFA